MTLTNVTEVKGEVFLELHDIVRREGPRTAYQKQEYKGGMAGMALMGFAVGLITCAVTSCYPDITLDKTTNCSSD